MLDAIFNAIAGLLAWFYELPIVGGSYGNAISLLTITIMIIVTPLTVRGTRSMMAMTALAPELKRIQQEFADDRERMNQEVLAFYRENKVNPVGGCLPMLLQAPLLIILWNVINGLTRLGTDGNFNPKYLDQFPDTQMYQDLSSGNTMVSWGGIDLARSAATALQDAFIEGLPYMVVILLVAGTAFLQQKQMSVRNPNVEMPAQQKILLRVLPVFFAFISFNFAAGVVLYFLVSNVYRIVQNALISMHLYDLKLWPALLGIGVVSIPGAGGDAPAKGAGAKPDGGSEKSPRPEKGSSPASGRDAGGSKNGRTPEKKKNGRTPEKKPNPQGDKPARPPSGRVTPKNTQGSGAAPTRRRKKRT